jgi:hypothetical protein
MIGRAGLLLLTAGFAAGVGSCTQDVSLPPSRVSATPDASPDTGPIRDAASATCDEVDFRQENPQVILALDRSASMWQKYNGSGFTRLEETQAAIKGLFGTYHAAVHVGYVEFPSDCPSGGSGCCASPVISPGRETGVMIQRRWDCAAGTVCRESGGDAPASMALRNARERFMQLDTAISSRHVFLITDSEPTCQTRPGTECSQAIAEAGLLWGNEMAETDVYALSDDLAASSCLQSIAGVRVDSNNPSNFHLAPSPEVLSDQLDERLAALSRKACTFRLSSPLRPPDFLVVSTGDGTTSAIVPQDRTSGWDFEPDSVRRFTIHGQLCEALRTSQPVDITVQVCTPNRGKSRRE